MTDCHDSRGGGGLAGTDGIGAGGGEGAGAGVGAGAGEGAGREQVPAQAPEWRAGSTASASPAKGRRPTGGQRRAAGTAGRNSTTGVAATGIPGAGVRPNGPRLTIPRLVAPENGRGRCSTEPPNHEIASTPEIAAPVRAAPIRMANRLRDTKPPGLSGPPGSADQLWARRLRRGRARLPTDTAQREALNLHSRLFQGMRNVPEWRNSNGSYTGSRTPSSRATPLQERCSCEIGCRHEHDRTDGGADAPAPTSPADRRTANAHCEPGEGEGRSETRAIRSLRKPSPSARAGAHILQPTTSRPTLRFGKQIHPFE